MKGVIQLKKDQFKGLIQIYLTGEVVICAEIHLLMEKKKKQEEKEL